MSAPPRLSDSAVTALVEFTLRTARANTMCGAVEHRRNGSISFDGHPGATLDLSRKNIPNIPPTVIRLIKDEIERLALAHNQLSSFADEFSSLLHLRYLNLRANSFTKFPLVLTQLPSLEVLDVSRNQLTSLPEDFGSLMSLKVLSISKNQISVLPTYIGSMPDLKIFKSYHNPIVFPPADIMNHDAVEQAESDAWLEGVKRFLRRHEEKEQGVESESSSLSSSEDGKQDGSSSSSLTTVSTSSISAGTSDLGFGSSENNDTATKSTTQQLEAPFMLSAQLLGDMTPSSFRTRSTSPAKWPMPQQQQLSTNTSIAFSSSPSSPRPHTPLSETNLQLSQLERSRSQSESASQLQTIRGNRRMGMLPPSRNSPNASSEAIGAVLGASRGVPRTIAERHHHHQHHNHQKTAKHQRGYSHDSVITSTTHSVKKMGKPSGVNTGNTRHSPTERERQPGPYFRRLSSLPEHKRSTLSSARVAEAARGILYAMSTLQRPIEQYVQSAVDPNGPHHKVERALYNGNIHIGSLVGALESYEEKDDQAAIEQVVDACYSCVAAFRQVLTMLQSSNKEIGAGVAGPDVRYMRTLLLTTYGSYVEVQSSYEILRPLLPKGKPVPRESSAAKETKGRKLLHNGNPGLRLASIPSTNLVSPLYATPRGGIGGGSGADYFSLPPTPGLQGLSSNVSLISEGGFDQDEPLYGTFQAAIGAALATLPVIEKEIKMALGQSLQPSTALKLKQVASLCVTGAEVARRLGKVRWDAIQEGDVGERRKFWEDANRFTNLVVNTAELIKSTHQEHTFHKHTLAAVGAVVRPTKDLYILMNGNSFRMYSTESSSLQPSVSPSILSPTQFAFQSMTTPQTWLAATPLSAALGPAAQATLPHGMYYPSPGLGGGGSGGGSVPGSRSATLLSMVHPAVGGALSGMGGMSLPGTPGEAPGSLGLGMGIGMPSGRGVGVGGMAIRMS